ncbi:hypothetical protein BDV96DRAFT_643863 [Lophiotrema nucula]|uniref:C3H1-type domain-containing protein n=1 Tax=Lophiotrema nucula TaxID=690887 RepID=A0A6A5ZGI4_9PLEO|nr:hypothetical protein BDV96DRAFT_643863 [Lophiotrema nucula]
MPAIIQQVVRDSNLEGIVTDLDQALKLHEQIKAANAGKSRKRETSADDLSDKSRMKEGEDIPVAHAATTNPTSKADDSARRTETPLGEGDAGAPATTPNPSSTNAEFSATKVENENKDPNAAAAAGTPGKQDNHKGGVPAGPPKVKEKRKRKKGKKEKEKVGQEAKQGKSDNAPSTEKVLDREAIKAKLRQNLRSETAHTTEMKLASSAPSYNASADGPGSESTPTQMGNKDTKVPCASENIGSAPKVETAEVKKDESSTNKSRPTTSAQRPMDEGATNIKQMPPAATSVAPKPSAAETSNSKVDPDSGNKPGSKKSTEASAQSPHQGDSEKVTSKRKKAQKAPSGPLPNDKLKHSTPANLSYGAALKREPPVTHKAENTPQFATQPALAQPATKQQVAACNHVLDTACDCDEPWSKYDTKAERPQDPTVYPDRYTKDRNRDLCLCYDLIYHGRCPRGIQCSARHWKPKPYEKRWMKPEFVALIESRSGWDRYAPDEDPFYQGVHDLCAMGIGVWVRARSLLFFLSNTNPCSSTSMLLTSDLALVAEAVAMAVVDAERIMPRISWIIAIIHMMRLPNYKAWQEMIITPAGVI